MVKKYLIGSIAILAATTLTTSCSNDDVFDASQDINVAKYDAMFIQKFGQPAANQTWGFGTTTTRAITAAKAVTRTIAPTYWNEFPSAPADADFAQTRDENAELLTGYKNGNLFYIDSSVSNNGQTLQPNAPWDAEDKSIVVYVEGTVVPTDIYFPGNVTLYLLPNSKLTIPATRSSFGQTNTKIYIAENAELIILGNQVEFGSGQSVYNKGQITAKNIVVSNNGLLYNQGTIDIYDETDANGKIRITNSNSVIVNDGTIKANYLGTEGSAHFQNNNTVTITGETKINSNNNTWVNNESYTTKYFNYTAGSTDVINNCKLTVTEKFFINLGQNDVNGFKLDGNCGVETKNFEAAGPCHIFMGNNSVFKVTNEAKMNITLENMGIYGPEDGDYAVFQAKAITNGAADPNQGFVACYYNKLYVICESHFAQGYSDKSAEQQANGEIGAQPYYKVGEGAEVYTGTEMPSVNIASTKCNPGISGGSKPIIRVMAEDLTVSDANKDFDFNDIVFTILEWTSDGVKVRLDAAGGTLPLIISNKDLTFKEDGNPAGFEGIDWFEVHEAFASVNPDKQINTDFSKGKLTMINTEAGKHYEYTCPELEITGDFTAEEGIDKAINIKIFVNKGTYDEPNWLELDAIKGKVAKKFGCDTKVDWCNECQDIEGVYGKFGRWVQGLETFFY